MQVRAMLILSLAVAGCCGGEDEDASGGSLTYSNGTPFYVHFLHPDEGRLYVAPGQTVDVHVSGGELVQVIVAPGQDAGGSFSASTWCCDQSCGAVEVTWEGGRLVGQSVDPSCPSGEGSCPYVFVANGASRNLVAEALTGALNIGAQRIDLVELPDLSPAQQRLEVEVAAVLSEDDHLDAAELWLIEHPAGILPVVDGSGQLMAAADPIAPRATRNAGGAVSDRLELEFDRPDWGDAALLLVSGRNTRFIQDSYHAYMRRYGPGLPKLMRATSQLSSYGPLVERLLAGSGMGLEVELSVGAGWKRLGRIGPIGPAGLRTGALAFSLPPAGSGTVRLRLSSLPGAWELGRIVLARPARQALEPLAVAPSTGALRSAAGRIVPAELELLARADGQRLVVAHGHGLSLSFALPPADPGRVRSVFLRLTGFYQELDRSPRPCLAFGQLVTDLRSPGSYSRFVAGRWAQQQQLGQLGSLAVMP